MLKELRGKGNGWVARHHFWEARHLAQRESASSKLSLVFPESPNSEMGEAFRKFKKGEKIAWQSPASQASSRTKYGSASGITTEVELGVAGSPVTGSNQNEYTEWKNDQTYTEDLLQELLSTGLTFKIRTRA